MSLSKKLSKALALPVGIIPDRRAVTFAPPPGMRYGGAPGRAFGAGHGLGIARPINVLADASGLLNRMKLVQCPVPDCIWCEKNTNRWKTRI